MRKLTVIMGAVVLIAFLSAVTILPAHRIDGDFLWGTGFFKALMIAGILAAMANMYKARNMFEFGGSILAGGTATLAFWSLQAGLPPDHAASMFAKLVLAAAGYLGSLIILVFVPVFFTKEG